MTHPRIPPLQPPHRSPRVRTTDELHRHWRALMGELGFGYRAVWFACFEPDGRPAPVLPRFEDVPLFPGRTLPANLVQVAEGVLDGMGDGASGAFLLSRPGTADLTTSDHAWVKALACAVERSRARIHPLMIATDQAVVIPPGTARAA